MMDAMASSERHFTAGRFLRDSVLGMSDGLTVPFALAAGLTGVVDSTHLIVVAGLAEIAAGAIAMGFGGYLAAAGEAEHYATERRREEREIIEKPETESAEVAEVFEGYGLTRQEIEPVLRALRARPRQWVDFMMRFELGLEAPAPRQALVSAVTIGGAYIAGGLIPLCPYVVATAPPAALRDSTAVTLAALGLFGFIRGRLLGARPLRSALQTALIGGVAAAAAFLIARAVSSP